MRQGRTHRFKASATCPFSRAKIFFQEWHLQRVLQWIGTILQKDTGSGSFAFQARERSALAAYRR